MACGGKILSASLALAALCAASLAHAQEFPAPTDRNYTIDVYLGSAIGSPRIIGMGGTGTATAEGSSGMLANPASPAVRATTSNDTWDWDWHLDSQNAAPGLDEDNNGIKTEGGRSFNPSATFGAALQYRSWGLGFTGIGQRTELALGNDEFIDSEALTTRLALSHSLLSRQLVVGVGIKTVSLTVSNEAANGDQQALLELAGTGIESGVVWKPASKSWRAGAALSIPVISDSSNTVENCDPLDCAGYVLPAKIKVPWQASLGFASRQAPSAWNQKVHSHWRDEKALLWATDLVITGTTHRGAGLEAFGQHMLQPSGRTVDLSVRAGVEYEWYPGRLRVRGGSYYEPGRFRDPEGQDIEGRLHMTLGFEWRFWSFHFWDDPYRLQLGFTADAASNFGNAGFSFGFWH